MEMTYVWRVSPNRHETSLDNCKPLLNVWHRIFSVVTGFIVLRCVTSAGDDLLYLLAQLFVFRALLPDITPVLALIVGITSTYSLQHVFGRVSLGANLLGAIILKILDEVLRVVAQITKINRSTSRFEKQELVKVLK